VNATCRETRSRSSAAIEASRWEEMEEGGGDAEGGQENRSLARSLGSVHSTPLNSLVRPRENETGTNQRTWALAHSGYNSRYMSGTRHAASTATMAVSACNSRAGRDDDDDDEETRERTTCLFSLLGWIGRSTLTAPPTSLAFRSAVSWYTGCFSGARGGAGKIAKQLRTLSLSRSLFVEDFLLKWQRNCLI